MVALTTLSVETFSSCHDASSNQTPPSPYGFHFDLSIFRCYGKLSEPTGMGVPVYTHRASHIAVSPRLRLA